MIATEPRLRSVGLDDGVGPDVRITDGAIEQGVDVPVIVIGDKSGVVEALQAGAAAVLSMQADGAILSAAAEAAVRGLVTVSPEFRDRLIEGPGGGAELESEAELEPAPVELTAREQQVL